VTDPTAGYPHPTAGYPQMGSTHKNGDRMIGIAGPYSGVLAGRGTPKLSSPYNSTITEHIRFARVRGELRVDWNRTHWWASSPAGLGGRLSWSKGDRARGAFKPGGRSPYDFDNGVLHMQNVTVDRAGAVGDCGGYVVPDDHVPSAWPITPMPDPAERQLTLTIGTSVQAQPTNERAAPPRRHGWLDRLMGR
jgi:hypothetical protein